MPDADLKSNITPIPKISSAEMDQNLNKLNFRFANQNQTPNIKNWCNPTLIAITLIQNLLEEGPLSILLFISLLYQQYIHQKLKAPTPAWYSYFL